LTGFIESDLQYDIYILDDDNELYFMFYEAGGLGRWPRLLIFFDNPVTIKDCEVNSCLKCKSSVIFRKVDSGAFKILSYFYFSKKN
jgi:hypothetical protein